MKKLLQITLLVLIINTTFAQTGNVGIGTASPDAAGALDITSTNKGLLIPRVSITDVTVFGLTTPTVSANVVGLLVYNTNASTTGGFGVGFYYWSGTSGPWTRIANGKISATLTNGKIWIGDATNNPVEQTMSGDITITNAGVTAIGTGKVTTTQILDGTIATIDIANGAVDGTKINLTSNATGDLMYYNGTNWVRLASATTGYVLQTTSGGAPSWVNPTTFSSWTKATTASTPAVKTDNQYVTGNVGIGDFSASSPLQTLDVNGRVNVTNGVIQRGGTAITGTSDLGLYSRVSGNWIRYVTNAAPHVWFTDDGTGTTSKMQLDANGNLSLPTTLNGTGTRPVYADASGVLKTNNKSSTGTASWTGSTTGTSWVVPAGVSSINVLVIGGGGGSGYYCCNSNVGSGGAGGSVSGAISVTPGETLTIVVGSGGSAGGNNGGGGKGSAIKRSSTILCAGGGGGGGSYNSSSDWGNPGGVSFGTSIDGVAATGGSGHASGGNNNIDYLFNPSSYLGGYGSTGNAYNYIPINIYFQTGPNGGSSIGLGGRGAYGDAGNTGAVYINY